MVKVRKFFPTHNLLINDTKTELILIGSKYQLNKIKTLKLLLEIVKLFVL